MFYFFFFFNDTATTEIYTLSLHDALPICGGALRGVDRRRPAVLDVLADVVGWEDGPAPAAQVFDDRSEEHTSELQSRQYLVCRLLLEKKKTDLHTSRRASVLTRFYVVDDC